MKHRSTLALFGYWNRRRGKRPAPLRREIEPADIQAILPNVFILEYTSGDRLAFRLAGTAICSLFGRELRNTPFESIWLSNEGGTALKQIGHARARGLPLAVRLQGESEEGRPVELELLLLPLAGTIGRIDGFLCTLNPLDKPFWLDLDPIVGVVTASLRLIDPDKQSVFLGNRPEIALPPAMAIYRSRGFGRDVQRLHNLTVIERGQKN